MRFHIGSGESIDPCLIAWPVCFESLKDLLIQPDGDRRLWFGETQYCAFEEGFAPFGNIREIDVLVPQGVNSCPIRPRSFLGSVLLHGRMIGRLLLHIFQANPSTNS